MASDNGGPWGGGGNRGGSGGGGDDRGGGRRPGNGQDGPQIPEIDDLMRKGQEQLRVLMGGKGARRSGGGGNGADGGGNGPNFGRGGFALVGLPLDWASRRRARTVTVEHREVDGADDAAG